ncbi:MAG: outer membrane protein TolC [Candidatus Paceibacteria bacterium]|jgi:outer membrane protein TolC
MLSIIRTLALPMTTTRPHAIVDSCPASRYWLLWLCLLGACSAPEYSRRADDMGTRILDGKEQDVLGGRYETVIRPEPLLEPEPETEAETQTVSAASQTLDLEQALALAVRGNRAHKARRESLFLQALSLSDVRNSFAPQVSLSLSYLFTDDEDLPWDQGLGIDARVSQILPWGGTLSADAGSGYSEVDFDGSFSTAASISLTQPLLRGAGAAISHESLIQAERDLIYAIRSFELQREDFAIDTARRFYDLVQRRKTIENLEQNLAGFVFGRRQAEALFAVGRTSELDVLRAKRSELTSRDSLISAEENNLAELDRFRIFLGLPREQPVEVLSEAPPYIQSSFVLDEAVELALANRLDHLTEIQQLEDVKRGLLISEDQLRPDLSLNAGFGVSSAEDNSFLNQPFGRDALIVGLSLGLPVDRFNEANSYRRAQINAVQAERDYEEFKDNLVVQIRASFRELERRRQSLDIQQELIVGQKKNVKIAQIRFEQGKVSNREVTEAQEALLDAQNSLINERVNYEISRLGLLRNLGILFIDERGMFKE